MRNTFLISTAALALSVGGALAAPAPPVVPMPIFTWTGCYIGVHAGGDSGHSSWSGVPVVGNVGYGTSGAIAGGQIGCNYQMQQFVIGAEGELWGSSLTGSKTLMGGEGGPFGFKTQSNLAGDIAARFGFAMDRTLFFGKIGAAWADYKFTTTYNNSGSPDTGKGTYAGLLLGIGVEYALDAHWSLKGEYDYINYGSKSIAMYENDGVLDYTPSISNSENIFKVGANYRW